MGKFVLQLRTGGNKRYNLFGFIADFKRPDYQYGVDTLRTTVAFIPPGRAIEGVVSKILGYDKLSPTPKHKEEQDE